MESHATSDGEIIGRVELPEDASAVLRGGEAAKAADYANYFCSYSFLYHQKQMLTDQQRMHAYHSAVMKNTALFEGKTVVDVGAGSGILSVWSAQAGASKVWAVEYTNMAKYAIDLVKCNGVHNVVTVVKGAIEELELPPQSVDVMISEWMGYFLLRESMLDSLIRARDRLLKPGGVMMPSGASMLWCPIECEQDRIRKDEEQAETMHDWKTFTDETAANYGVDMTCLEAAYAKEQHEYFSLSSQWMELDGEQVVSTPVVVKSFDLNTCTIADALGVDNASFSFTVDKASRVSAFAGWFDAVFAGSPSSPCTEVVTLSTHPRVGYTHWGQQVFFLEDAIDLEPEDELVGTMSMYRTKDSARLYHVAVNYRVERKNGSVFAPVNLIYEIP